VSAHRVSALGGLQSLRELSLADTSVTDFSPLHDLRTLTTLDLDGTATRPTEITALRHALPAMEVLQ
jgi:Leucine-rich repeat (LRR) protein